MVRAPGVPAPGFVWFEEDDPKKETAERDKTLSETGVKFTKSYYVRQYGLEEDDFDLVAPTAGQPGTEFAEGDAVLSPEQQGIESLVEKVIPEGSKGIKENEAAILEVIQTADGYEDAMERLLELYPKMDTTAMADVLERALLAAEAYGRHTAHAG